MQEPEDNIFQINNLSLQISKSFSGERDENLAVKKVFTILFYRLFITYFFIHI